MTRKRPIAILLMMCALSLSLPLAGCGNLLGSEGPRISVSLARELPLTAPLVLLADIGARRVHLTVPEQGSGQASAEAGVSRYGDVPVRVTLRTLAGDSLAAVAFTQRFERDHRHWVSAQVGRRRPTGHCIGNVVLTPLRSGMLSGASAEPDTLYVMYGSIQKDAIC